MQTNPEELPPIKAWEEEDAEENEKWERSWKDQVNNETLKAGDETIAGHAVH